uniref:SET domain-containing protein n=1 Tax=Macrostomum lignano TaxID=282301 RepID=A0A1I8F8X5_9PLAT
AIWNPYLEELGSAARPIAVYSSKLQRTISELGARNYYQGLSDQPRRHPELFLHWKEKLAYRLTEKACDLSNSLNLKQCGPLHFSWWAPQCPRLAAPVAELRHLTTGTDAQLIAREGILLLSVVCKNCGSAIDNRDRTASAAFAVPSGQLAIATGRRLCGPSLSAGPASTCGACAAAGTPCLNGRRRVRQLSCSACRCPANFSPGPVPAERRDGLTPRVVLLRLRSSFDSAPAAAAPECRWGYGGLTRATLRLRVYALSPDTETVYAPPLPPEADERSGGQQSLSQRSDRLHQLWNSSISGGLPGSQRQLCDRLKSVADAMFGYNQNSLQTASSVPEAGSVDSQLLLCCRAWDDMMMLVLMAEATQPQASATGGMMSAVVCSLLVQAIVALAVICAAAAAGALNIAQANRAAILGGEMKQALQAGEQHEQGSEPRAGPALSKKNRMHSSQTTLRDQGSAKRQPTCRLMKLSEAEESRCTAAVSVAASVIASGSEISLLDSLTRMAQRWRGFDGTDKQDRAEEGPYKCVPVGQPAGARLLQAGAVAFQVAGIGSIWSDRINATGTRELRLEPGCSAGNSAGTSPGDGFRDNGLFNPFAHLGEGAVYSWQHHNEALGVHEAFAKQPAETARKRYTAAPDTILQANAPNVVPRSNPARKRACRQQAGRQAAVHPMQSCYGVIGGLSLHSDSRIGDAECSISSCLDSIVAQESLGDTTTAKLLRWLHRQAGFHCAAELGHHPATVGVEQPSTGLRCGSTDQNRRLCQPATSRAVRTSEEAGLNDSSRDEGRRLRGVAGRIWQAANEMRQPSVTCRNCRQDWLSASAGSGCPAWLSSSRGPGARRTKDRAGTTLLDYVFDYVFEYLFLPGQPDAASPKPIAVHSVNNRGGGLGQSP